MLKPATMSVRKLKSALNNSVMLLIDSVCWNIV